MSIEKKVFFLYTLVIAVLIITGVTFRYIYDDRISYYIVVRIYNIIEYSLLAYFFSLHLKNKVIKNILLFSPTLFASYAIYNFIIAKEPALPFVPLIFEYIILLCFIIYFFFEIMQETVVEPVYQRMVFWISVAFILNFSGNFFLFLYSKNSFNDEEFQRQYTIIYSSVTILKNILLCIAVSIKEPKKESKIFEDFSINSKLDNSLPFKNQN